MIGILPCAGTAERFQGLPKYLLPCPNDILINRHVMAMRSVGADVLIGVREETLDLISDYVHYGIFYIPETCETMTQTVLWSGRQASATINDKVKNQNILFGMPDTYFECPDVYQYLSNELDHADVVVAVCRARPKQHLQGGMVSFSRNQVLEVVDKPEHTRLEYIWGALAWRPVFWECLKPDMPHVGYGLNVAIERGLNVRAVLCEGNYFDCGNFDRYAEFIRAVTT